MCDLSYHHKVHSYAVCVWLTHIYEYDAHSSYHCEAHSQFHYECEAHSHLSYHCETVTHGYDALFYVTSTYETHNYTIV